MKRMVRFGRTPAGLIARSESMTSAALHPLSSAPVPSSQESRCAPMITISFGSSLPFSSATTLLVVIGGPIFFAMGQQARDPLSIFARQQNLRDRIDVSGAGIDVPV